MKALYFAGANGWQTKDGPEASVTAKPAEQTHKRFQIHFTRGYIASQAYRDRFNNANIRPKGAKSPTFDTKPFLPQYQWLGADARAALFDFIADCESDARAKIDVYAYDLDEPDVIAAICAAKKAAASKGAAKKSPAKKSARAGSAKRAAAKKLAHKGSTKQTPAKKTGA